MAGKLLNTEYWPDVAVVIPLKLVYTPVDATVTAIRNYQVPSTKWQRDRRAKSDLFENG